jgi:hypothetical protein
VPCAACSCAAPASLAEAVVRSPDLAVFVGKVVALEGDATTGGGVATVAVDGRFRGPILPPTIRARYGGGGDCTIGMALHERRLFTARLDEGGVWFPALCEPQGVLGTPEGDALLAEALSAFGPSLPVSGPPIVDSSGPDLVVIAAAAAIVLVIGLVLVVGVTAVARRSRREAG